MPYAEGRAYFDADSHLMEYAEWLADFADPAIQKELPAFVPHGSGGANALLDRIDESRKRVQDPEATASLETDVMRTAKGWAAHGAMDPAERSRTLDLLGFQGQLVFSTFALLQVLGCKSPQLMYGATRAHNRGIVEFCSSDKRLLPVGFIPLHEPRSALDALGEALESGCSAIMVPTDAAGKTSPTHVDLESFWAMLAESGTPLMSHVGGGKLLAKRYHNNGRPIPKDWLGGGENLRGKDFPVIHHSPERFLACMVLDGVFERHEGLRCGVIEQGASWVPAMLSNLDHAARQFGKFEPDIAKLSLRPSDYIHRQVKFTPFSFEDAGWLIEQAGEDLFLFSSDYPHPEGSRDPLGRFEASLDSAQINEAARERFYSLNFLEMMGR
jgi:predicted TIM-barrel fold metal-dependent hydrolase